MSKDNKQNINGSATIIALITVAILIAAGALSYMLISNPAHSEKKEELQKPSDVVKIEKAVIGDYPVKIEVMGQVIPAHETLLKSRVPGEIIEVSPNFVPGGLFKKGEFILKIDPADYELDVKVKTAALNQAKAVYNLELGQQQIAKDEMKMLERSTGRKLKNTSLALRKPQLEQAKANLESAKAALEIAELSLERTNVKAPYNALVRERLGDIGNVFSSLDRLATLVSTDKYWIDIEVPINDMVWLEIPNSGDEKGSKAIIKLGNMRGTRDGYLFKQSRSVDPQSRLASMLVNIPDPLLLNSYKSGKSGETPLVLSDFVPVTLIGKTLKDAFRVPLNYIREGSNIWLEKRGGLIIQPVTIAYKDRKYAYITSGLERESHIVTSNIITPINGMEIMVQGSHENMAGEE